MRVNSKQNIFNILIYVSDYSFFACDVHFRKLGQIQHILTIEDYQLPCFSSILYPVGMALFINTHHSIIRNINYFFSYFHIFHLNQLFFDFLYKTFLSFDLLTFLYLFYKFNFQRMYSIDMNIKSQKIQQYSTKNPNYQEEILLHKIKQLEAKVCQENVIAETLKFHNEELDRQMSLKNQIFNKMKQQNEKLKNKIIDLQKQLDARKKSAEQMIRQLRNQNSIIKEKNIKMCEIVRYLETQTQQYSSKQKAFTMAEQGLRKRIQQLTAQNQNIRRRMAKSEVNSEKYKLKAIEGEKYWSSKLQKTKQKEHETLIEKYNDLRNAHNQEIIILKSDLMRYQKIIKLKDEQISKLEKRIQQMIIQND